MTFQNVYFCQGPNRPDEVLVTTTHNDRATSYTKGLGSVSVTENGELVATYNGNEVYRSMCVCNGHSCANDHLYEVKLQIDGNLFVVPKGKKNADRVWKSNKWTNDAENEDVSLVVDGTSLQVWKQDKTTFCYEKIWDSKDDVNTPNCRGKISTSSSGNGSGGDDNGSDGSGGNGNGDSSDCLAGITVITTSYERDYLPSYENDGAKAEVTMEGDFICKHGNSVIYQSNCKCTKKHNQHFFFRRNLHQCLDPYVIKLQNDGNLLVKNKDDGRHWKTNKTSNHGKHALVINNGKCQIWKVDHDNCPKNLLWDSGDDHHVSGVKCDGYQH